MKSGPAAEKAQVQAQQLFQDLGDISLRDLAGDKVFQRGKSYACAGAVQDLKDLSPTPDYLMGVQATVVGTELYQTEIWWLPDDDLSGDCDCPQGDDGFFCKHQVALAMVWRTRLGGAAITPDPDAQKKAQAAAKRAQTRANNMEALRQFVLTQTAEDLAALLWNLASWDKDVMASLKAWQAQSVAKTKLSSGDTVAAQEAIRELLKNPKGYLEPRDCGPYQRRAEQIFPIIESVFAQSPAQARSLCEDAIKRLYKVGETADDSWGGEFSDLIPKATDWLKRCLQADHPPASWLKTWLSLADKDPWGLVQPQEVINVAGPAVQAAYSAQVAKDWHAWHLAHPQPSSEWDQDRHKRRKAYLDDLKRQGDEATAFDVMRSTATTAREWAELVLWCEQRKRWREAFSLAQQAFKQHPKDRHLEDALLRAYERDGWDEEALTLWRKRLERDPSSAHYVAVLKAAQRVGHDMKTYRQSLMDWAQAQERRIVRPVWNHKATQEIVDVSVRVRWYLEVEKDLQAALELVYSKDVQCHSALLLVLANALPNSHDVQAKALLLKLFEDTMPRASTPYTEVLKLVHLALKRMSAPDRAAWLGSLRTQYKAKRNFIKELPIS